MKLDIAPIAPSSNDALEYDRRHLALYAVLLDADESATGWREAAASLMDLDPAAEGAEACWRSHLERAKWIIGDGLGSALKAFGESNRP